jgi:hypothetical protein
MYPVGTESVDLNYRIDNYRVRITVGFFFTKTGGGVLDPDR